MTGRQAFTRLRALDDGWKSSFTEAGLLLKKVESEMLWRDVEGCNSFTSFIHLACPYGYATAFAALRAVRDLADVPDADLVKIPSSNIGVLRQLSTQVRAQPEVIHAAKYDTTAAFVERIKAVYPDQHLETKKVLRFMADETQESEIEEGIELAIEDGAQNRTEALVNMSISYRASALLEKLTKETHEGK
jgi:hypothetical protein